MKLSRLNKCILYFAVIFVNFVIMQSLQEYRLYAKEAEHLWLNDWMWMEQQLFVPGGFVQVFTSFFTQFFQFWGVGSLILSILFGLSFALLFEIGQFFKLKDSFVSFWLFPLIFLILCNEHSYFNLKGHFAFTFSLLFSYLFLRYFAQNRPWLKTEISIVFVAVGYALVGSSIVIFATIVFLYELFVGKTWLNSVSPLMAFVLCAGFSVKCKYFVDYETALTPLQYYEWPTTYFFPLYAWISVPVILVIGILLNRDCSKRINYLLFVGGVVAAFISFVNMFWGVHNDRVYQLRKDEWMARNKDWDGIIESHKNSKDPTPFISYLNLALAEKGVLVQRMMQFNPYIVWSEEAKRYSPVLMTNDELSRDALKLQSCVFMRWGGSALANAQKSAFEANFLTPGNTDPIELQRLIVTNTLFDTSKTAEKYARRLSRTTFYKNTLLSPSQLSLLVEDLRKTLPEDDSFYMKTQIGKILRDIVFQTPNNKVAAQFYEAYLIQTQDSVAYRLWKEL